MRCLILGSTGMLGQALAAEAASRGHDVVGAARNGGDERVDIADSGALAATLDRIRPELIVNSAAIVSLDACERDPEMAYAVNARPLATLAEWSELHGCKLVQISTDHFFTRDGQAKHDEDAAVTLLNEYARTKFEGERFALRNPDALVVRTNVTGFRGDSSRPTFIEWAIGALRRQEPLTLFDDFWTSTIASRALAAAVFELLDAQGVLNVASSQVSTKKEFIEALAARMALEPGPIEVGSVRGLEPPRAESLGLDVSRAEALLGRPLPDLAATVDALASEAPS